IHASREQLELEDHSSELAALSERISRSEPDLPSIHTPLAREQHLVYEQQREQLGELPIEATAGASEARAQRSARRGETLTAIRSAQPTAAELQWRSPARRVGSLEHVRSTGGVAVEREHGQDHLQD